MAMIVLRSLIFNIVFVINNILWFIFALPLLMLPRKMVFLKVLHPWCWTNLKLHSWICNVRMEFRGRENIPTGGFMVASKHQSAWETLALAMSFPEPRYILKQELMWVPLFGFYLMRTGQVPINRGSRTEAIAAMNKASQLALKEGGQLLIFPEGTRRPVGAAPAYKQGVAHMYETLNATVLPVAINAGVFWPRRTFLKYPGTIVMEFLPPIPPGLPKDVFFERLQDTIETATNRLVAEAGGPKG
ncbi:MAG: 1-acyl-sn-glycerol-3-phosphate acyltransferase [Methylocystis sp.]|nr:1-acyl-sn-glycerol-3-phosphate acyltransferase [Methylocystis sp.]MCA3583178.1 1-acyl-sn-glycerol-3-phosphate acyltransferase [Methylocystis sp.]MCA3587617.1 1-acyl-sn-glycerol-3-phosphate acyltransferase [Methylocystis sp.]MCA3590744.1 1-acyl-sn-glycerol-3-phosphate acyltransferase [Methylocystis sp.]